MTCFIYKNGSLHAEDVPLQKIAESVGTPAYIYSTQMFVDNYKAFDSALGNAFPEKNYTICFAMKANGNLAVLKTLARLGSGADIVSGGELTRALAAGIPARKIAFSGVGKTREELAAALRADILQINVESLPELEALSAVAAKLNTTARVALRVNPDVDAGTHAKITTGKKENKFGIDFDLARDIARQAKSLPGIDLKGIAIHIGSQLTALAPFESAFARVAELVVLLRKDGHDIRTVDLGGGLGITYKDEIPPCLNGYADLVGKIFGSLDLHILLEPGRAIAGAAGILLSRVIYVKSGTARTFAIIDAAMNDLMRPSLYDAYHPIWPVREQKGSKTVTYDVVGPVCETGDTFALQRDLPELAEGDLVAIGASGAYGAVMASGYNARPLVPEILVNGKDFAVVRPRPEIHAILENEVIPEWLTADGHAKEKTA